MRVLVIGARPPLRLGARVIGAAVELTSGARVLVAARSADVNQALRRGSAVAGPSPSIQLVVLGQQLVNPNAVARVYELELDGLGDTEELAEPL